MKVPPKKKSENTTPDASDASTLATNANSPTADEVDESKLEETPPATSSTPPPADPAATTVTPAKTEDKADTATTDAKPAPKEKEQFFVKLIQDHNCSIGGVSYKFKAGERVPVPFNVKCVLSRANLLRG